MSRAEVFVDGGLLLGLVSRFGRRPEWQPTSAWLKLARDTELAIASSVIDFLDSAGRVLGSYPSAFGLAAVDHLRGPYCEQLADERPFPALSTQQRWRLNDREVCGPVAAPRAALRCIYLPLQVPLPDDPHFIIGFENLTERPVNIADAMCSARCWVDGVPFDSIAGRVWNEVYLTPPGSATNRRFRLADFPGAPRSGAHLVSLEFAGLRTPEDVLEWTGEPWLAPNAP